MSPGFYFITLDSPQVTHDRRHLQTQSVLVATANLTLKTTATEAMIWLTDLNSGQPLASVPVAFYDENFNLIFRDTTDNDGLIYRDDLTLETGYRTTYYRTIDADQYLFWDDVHPTRASHLIFSERLRLVPVPAAAWLFGSGLIVLVWARRRSM